MDEVGRSMGEEIGKDLLEFAQRFWQVMSNELSEIEKVDPRRYWEAVAQSSHLRRAIEEAGDGSDPKKLIQLLTRMRVVLDAFGGRSADSEPDRRAQSVEERNWYVQWSQFRGHLRDEP